MSQSVALQELSDAEIHRDVVRYYDECEADYRIVWHLKNHLSIHYGYWEDDTRRLRDALRLMNVRLAEIAHVSSSDRVLDAGCGVGGSAIFLAKEFGCRVHGISLSANQIERSEHNAELREVADLVTFEQADFCRTGQPDQSFDVVWAIESVCHAVDKSAFLREAARILRPGGRMIVADFFREDLPDDSEDLKLVRRWANAWAVPDFAVKDTFGELAERAGFSSVDAVDISEKIEPTVRRLHHAFYPGIVCSTVLRALGRRNRLHVENTWSTYIQYKAFMKGLWRYWVVTATKRGGN